MPAPACRITLIQCAEQLEAPEEVLRTTYSNSTWQNHTFDAAKAVARGDRARLADWGLSLGLFGYSEQETTNGDVVPKSALQYIENHDHERFICNFGMTNPDEAGNPLFFEGDRNNWYMLQPYLIATLLSKGQPMLWQGEEFAENYFLPDFGAGRVALLRALRWDFFYDTPGQKIVELVRKLLRVRKNRSQIRRGSLLLLRQLGSVSEPRCAALCALQRSPVQPCGHQYRRHRSDGAILVSGRRQLC